jgi:phage terminase Nu1 subunit (DNA packaging protein)
VFPTASPSLTAFLAEREALPAIGVVGLFFGTSGHQEPPVGRVVDHYTQGVPLDVQKRFPRLLNIKSFVQPRRVAVARSAHYFDLVETSAVAYSEHGVPLAHLPRRKPGLLSVDLIRYNHYFTRSQSEFEAKRVRRSVRGVRFKAIEKTRSETFALIQENAVTDTAISPWAEKLSTRLEAGLPDAAT